MPCLLIFRHLISADQIAGIGPLMYREPADAAMRDYGARQHFFQLHLKGHSIEIVSDWFEMGGTNHLTDHNRKEIAAYHAFQYEYGQLILRIMEMLGGEVLTKQKPHPPKPVPQSARDVEQR